MQEEHLSLVFILSYDYICDCLILFLSFLFILIGLVGGSVWHFFGGIKNAPKGAAMQQAVSRVRARVPITGGWNVFCEFLFSYLTSTFFS